MELKDYRAKIDEIDAQIAHLFAERMQAAEAIADYKAQNHLPIYHPAREREVLLSASQAAAPYSREARVVFGAMMDVSRSRQAARLAGESPLTQAISRAVAETPATFPQNATVACQGIEGAYSHQAANRLFALPQILFFQRFDGVFQAVEKGLCRYGVLPIENSSAGSVTEVYDLMKGRDFSIVRGTRLHIVHALLTRGAKLGQIREVISHEQAVRQCAPFLKAHPEIRVTLCANTAVAAQTVANSGRDDLAAIASPACAEIYGLTALPDSIQASDNNHTRFIVISKKPEIYPGANRISLMLTLPHVAGSLYRMIARFSALEMNLLKIESRPIPGRDFEFMFYFDVEASCANPEVLSLLAELESTVSQFAFLGNYAEV
ncbi:MAG TPA: chorismate mutase [Candidatus Alectryocaccomicrobium excrementavium]|uniref:Bifunctional chorismate mutase/prephenate dehydratase n=1 Tax=Candidatus Alectryocaccomicrobium excrementavium TaxID=2840668 RepID=A0A9D1K5Y1_9FIRM|nr:chorismate mutase [Candidatus Alectryocaccomicrobium excrementavium]